MKEMYLLHKPYTFNGVEVKRSESIFSLVGVPFDSTSSYRPGARFAPLHIREASTNIELFSLRSGIDMEKVFIYDEGDLAVVPSDPSEVLKRLEYIVEELINEKRVPIFLGGEHIITYGVIKGCKKQTCILFFDAHADLRNDYLGLKLSHACTLKRIGEHLGFDKVLLLGLRALTSDEMRFIKQNNLRYVTSLMFKDLSFRDIVNSVRKFLRNCENVYISIDMDVIDPAYAPGVSNPEPEGLTPSYILDLLYEVIDERVWGFDVVEVAPPYDNSGITSVLAAKLVNEIASYIYVSRIKKS